MKLVVCPDEPDFSGVIPDLVFMAGGITGVPDWQKEMFSLVEKRISDDYVYLNPRRPQFDVRDESLSDDQIGWEYRWIARSRIMTFWFASESLCPITLFELGKELGQLMGPFARKKIFIGVHPDYARKIDVLTQARLVDPDISISFSLPDLADQLVAYCQ